MDYLTYSYMIDNVALLITGTLHERDTKELLERCHPLGWFETMPVLCVATNIEELYNSVLIETPLAPYFKGSLSHQDLDELNIEIVRNTLYKNYLEDFHKFVNSDPEMAMTPTGEIMSEILAFEADRRAINITINSFGTELTKEQRRKLYPEFGKLYPEGNLMLSRADDLEGVGLAVSGVGDYKRFFEEVGFNQSSSGGGNMSGQMGGGESKSLEDMFYQKEMELSKMVFTRQFTHAVIYAWVKLREQVQSEPVAIYMKFELIIFPGNPQHHLDCRMHCPEPERSDRKLHQCFLGHDWASKEGILTSSRQHGVMADSNSYLRLSEYARHRAIDSRPVNVICLKATAFLFRCGPRREYALRAQTFDPVSVFFTVRGFLHWELAGRRTERSLQPACRLARYEPESTSTISSNHDKYLRQHYTHPVPAFCLLHPTVEVRPLC